MGCYHETKEVLEEQCESAPLAILCWYRKAYDDTIQLGDDILFR